MKIQLIIPADGKGTDEDQDFMERTEGRIQTDGWEREVVGGRVQIIYLVNNNRLIEHSRVGPGIIQDDRRRGTAGESEGVY